MMSISTLGAAGSDKASYCQSSVSQEGKTEGYYQKTDAPGVWHGESLAAFGIMSGDRVSDDQFAALTRGIDPTTGEHLVQGAGDQHRAGWDLTFSAPKSVSVVWAVAGDADREAIEKAHNAAVRAAMAHLSEQAAFARRGKGGAEQEQLGGLISADYLHTTTRELDPDLHTHALALNLAQRSDGTWGGIESKHLYNWKMAAGAIYRAELAEQMERLGFKTEADRDYFRIVGVSNDLCGEWSKRREQIEAALAESGASGAKASELAALGSRKAKQQDQDPVALRARWSAEAAAYGLTAETVAGRSLAPEQAPLIPVDAVPEAQAQEETSIYDKLTRSNSTFSARELWAAAAIEMQHAGKGYESVKARVSELLSDKEVVRLRNKATGELRFSTRSMVKIEREMAGMAQRMKASGAHAVPSAIIDKALADFAASKGFALSEEQQAAVRHILENSSALSLVRGAAGAGKSTMAEAVRMALEAQGYTVRGAALAGKAAEGLETGSGIKSQTIHSLLFSLESGKDQLTAKTVLVVDEAGMVGSRQMSKLLNIVEKSGAKIVLVGDERQLQAVDAGGSFKAIQNITGFASLDEIRRQRDAWARDAVNDFSAGEAATALEKFIERDLIKIDENKPQAMASVVDAWLGGRDPAKPSEAVILASTRDDVATLNNLVRVRLKEAGALTGFSAEIINHQSRKLEFQQGDRLLFRKNDKNLGVKNGTLGTVKRIEVRPDGSFQFSVALDDGKTVEFSPTSGEKPYSALEHGYALTTHKSQGITVDRAYVLAGGSMQDRETTYVQMSRSRHETKIFFTTQQVEEMAEVADANPPTAGMLKYAQSTLAKMEKQGLEVEKFDENSFMSVRSFLNEHSKTQIDADTDVVGGNTESKKKLEDLSLIIKQMENSRAKDTTLDYVQEQAQETVNTEPEQLEQQQENEDELEF